MKLTDFPDLQQNVPLHGYSTFNVGGGADYFINLTDLAKLPGLLADADQENIPVFILGGGSNVLFSDDGFPGLIVRIAADSVHLDGRRMVAEAGAKWPSMLRIMREAGLGGLEPFEGLPGTIGGAVAGNAGCFGAEIKDFFDSAQIYDRATHAVRTVTTTDLEFRYRGSRVKDTHDVVLSVTLLLKPEPGTSVSSKERMAKQPPGRTSGSFFKNPSPDKPAGWLIDQCGLKGHQIGGAQISPKHANFFMNTGNATAHDILALRDLAKEKVREKFNIELQEEVVEVKI
jgi:UDP-N-acetylmuramate dehydrogenase